MDTLYPAFQQAAARFGAGIAIRDGDVSISWNELERLSRRAARALLSLGLEAGDCTSIWATNHWRWPVTGLAGQAAGATLIPASTRLKAPEIADFLRRAKAKILFCDPGFGSYDFVSTIAAEDLPDLRHIIVFDDVASAGRVMGWDSFLAHDAASDAALDARIASIRPDAVADIIFTSGTTGQPKGVPMTHAQSLIACEQQDRCVSRFVAGDVFAVTLPFAHNAGYRAGWQAAVLSGVTIVPVRSYDTLDLIKLIDREKVSVIPAVPTIFQAILDHPDRERYDLGSIRLALTGATTIPVALIEQMQAVFGVDAVSTGYGLTEAAGSVTHTRPGDAAATIATTVGRPLDNLEVVLVDREHRPVAPGGTGEIAVRGPQVMMGYYQDEEANRTAFTSGGFLLTGDVGVLDADGNLSITDRIKDVYLVGGFNAYPAEIEQRLRTLDGVADVAVIGVDDDRLGQVGKAFIIRRDGASLDAETVIAWCRHNMANYKVPRTIAFVDDLPRNATGKVSKVELRAMA